MLEWKQTDNYGNTILYSDNWGNLSYSGKNVASNADLYNANRGLGSIYNSAGSIVSSTGNIFNSNDTNKSPYS